MKMEKTHNQQRQRAEDRDAKTRLTRRAKKRDEDQYQRDGQVDEGGCDDFEERDMWKTER
jgi:hypothetical protein